MPSTHGGRRNIFLIGFYYVFGILGCVYRVGKRKEFAHFLFIYALGRLF